jgi:hypothetical protein
MTKDEIIRMAREAGFESHDAIINHPKELQRFAALVAAAERERIIAANAPEIEKVNVYIKALEDAAAIRERGQ